MCNTEVTDYFCSNAFQVLHFADGPFGFIFQPPAYKDQGSFWGKLACSSLSVSLQLKCSSLWIRCQLYCTCFQVVYQTCPGKVLHTPYWNFHRTDTADYKCNVFIRKFEVLYFYTADMISQVVIKARVKSFFLLTKKRYVFVMNQFFKTF